jgi:dolichol-phosphate mannosyltransferase
MAWLVKTMVRFEEKRLSVRYLQFNLVGVLGIVVQLTVLSIAYHVLGWHYLVSTALAVEAAVLQNFVWHERWTWSERCEGSWRDSMHRLIRFHAGNGVVSVAGNLLLMKTLVAMLAWPVLLANLVSIAACSLANFALGHWYVFPDSETQAQPGRRSVAPVQDSG